MKPTSWPRSLSLPVLSLLGIGLLTAACGDRERGEIARLEAENEALRTRLIDAKDEAEVPGSAGLDPAEDWSWAEGKDEPKGPEPEPSHVILPAPEPEPPAPKPAPRVEPPAPPRSPEPRAQAPTPRPAPAPKPPAPEPPVEQAASVPVPEPPRVEERRAAVGSAIAIATVGELDSQSSQVGDRVHAVLDRDLLDPEGRVVLPAGTALAGRVTEVQAAKKVKKKSRLSFQLDTATLPDGRTVAIAAHRSLEGEGWRKKDGAIIGGSAAGGAVLGQVLGGDSESTAAGAVIGGAIASGVLMSRKGEATVVPDGSIIELTLQDVVVVEQPVAAPTPAG